MPRADELLAIVRDFERSSDERFLAFHELLRLTSGWWGEGVTLREFAVARATYHAERRRRAGFPGDLLDAEAVADDAVLLLSDPDAVIQGDTASWMVGVIKNLLASAITRERIHTRSASFDDPDQNLTPPTARNSREIDHTSDEITASWAFGRALVAALRAMPPGRRRTTRSVLRILVNCYVHKRRLIGFKELAKQMGKSPDAIRQDWQRGRKDIEASVRAVAPGLLRMLGPLGDRFRKTGTDE